jgi:hypothetical protein
MARTRNWAFAHPDLSHHVQQAIIKALLPALSRRSISASVAAASSQDSCLKCCSVSDDTFPIRLFLSESGDELSDDGQGLTVRKRSAVPSRGWRIVTNINGCVGPLWWSSHRPMVEGAGQGAGKIAVIPSSAGRNSSAASRHDTTRPQETSLPTLGGSGPTSFSPRTTDRTACNCDGLHQSPGALADRLDL